VGKPVDLEASRDQDGHLGPSTSTEKVLAEILAEVVRAERVSVDSHFFDDLAADSLVMAHFCARVRKREELPAVSIRDVYRNPTIRELAAAVGDPAHASAAMSAPAPAPVEPVVPVSTWRYGLCGAAQFLILLAYSYGVALVLIAGYRWITAGSGVVETYVRAVAFGGAVSVGLVTFSIAAKWILVGRWKPGEFPAWGLAYLRLWTVKAIIHANPLILFVGNPLYVLYLRALGARIGKGVTILSRHVPVCTDLLTVGDGTVIRKDCYFLGYRAHAGRIQTGAVTLGRGVYVGEQAVLDINTAIGDGAQLGHTSALPAGMSVPDGQRWHGSPAQPTELDYQRVTSARCGTVRRAVYAGVSLLPMLFLYLPLFIGAAHLLVAMVPTLGQLGESGTGRIGTLDLLATALVVSLAVFFGSLVLGLAVVCTVPRLLYLMIKPDKVYPLYGAHYALHRAVGRMTNIKFFKKLFGDSSYIVYYLRHLGYDLSRVIQTGANFGSEMQHDNPYLSFVGSGTMVCDGLSLVNADYSSTSFRLSQASIGPRNFLGNHVVFPTGARTGADCLLATKVMVPLDGQVRHGVGLLGSPPFEIPRSVERDSRFDHLHAGDELRRGLAAKNRYNLRTMGVFLLANWLHFFVFTALGLTTITLYDDFGLPILAAFPLLNLVFGAAYFVLVERTLASFRPLRPQYCSIYEPPMWLHERLWKVPRVYYEAFNGTPFKNTIWRLLGVRIGRRVLDDGCILTDRTLVAIGDDCTLNAGSKIQSHSMEDNTFKADRISIGAGCTLGVNALVHYGVTMGENAVLAADSFLMKGEEVPSCAQWGGNPARAVTSHLAHRAPAPLPAQPTAHPAGSRQ
jgi:non-ribosomal peptide synthetase-like protein